MNSIPDKIKEAISLSQAEKKQCIRCGNMTKDRVVFHPTEQWEIEKNLLPKEAGAFIVFAACEICIRQEMHIAEDQEHFTLFEEEIGGLAIDRQGST